jgi:hypothetical protein
MTHCICKGDGAADRPVGDQRVCGAATLFARLAHL